MDKQTFTKAIKGAREGSPERNFKQTVELIINLKDLDLKNPEEQVDFFITTPNDMKIKRSVCALVGPELKDEAKKNCDAVIEQSNFDSLEAKEIKKIAKEHDFFVAQANIMPKVATAFGKYLGPRGKMPNPKAGSVVAPKASLGPLQKKLQNTLKIQAKTAPVIHLVLGKEDLDDEKLAENATFIYNQLVHKLPKEINNIKNMHVKLTMGKPVKVE